MFYYSPLHEHRMNTLVYVGDVPYYCVMFHGRVRIGFSVMQLRVLDPF